jgi:sigma-B regulation protein RsbQ
MWRYITPAFEFGYRVILFDYVGSGRSDMASYSPDRYATLDGYAQDLLDICQELKLKDVVLVGHSISGMIGMIAALKKPKLFSNIIMVGSSACYTNKENGYTGGLDKKDVDTLLSSMEQAGSIWARPLGTRTMGNPKRPELVDELTTMFTDMEPGVARQFAGATFGADYRDKLSMLKVPTLIVQCAEDVVVPMAAAQYLHDTIKDSRLEVLDATGHYPCLSAPDEIIDVIKDYLEAGKEPL